MCPQAWQDNLAAWYDDYSAAAHGELSDTKARFAAAVEDVSYAPSTCVAEQYTADERAAFAARKDAYDDALAARRARERAAARAVKEAPASRGERGGALLAAARGALSNNTFVDGAGDVEACGSSEWATCDDAYIPSCTCRYGDDETHYGGDYWCDFGSCFSSDCVDHGVRNFSCSFTAVPR